MKTFPALASFASFLAVLSGAPLGARAADLKIADLKIGDKALSPIFRSAIFRSAARAPSGAPDRTARKEAKDARAGNVFMIQASRSRSNADSDSAFSTDVSMSNARTPFT